MNILKKITLASCGLAFCLNGCGSDSSSSSSESEASVPETPEFKIEACKETTDIKASQQLELAKQDIQELYKALYNRNLDKAQSVSAAVKNEFKNVLTAFPDNCEAQLGYGLATATDIINNELFKKLIDDLDSESGYSIFEMDPEDAANVMLKASVSAKQENQKVITAQIQEAFASAIPSIDSAIIYLRNVVSNEDFTVLLDVDGKTFELDKGEFAPATGALFIAKSIATAVASLNIDASLNKSYAWIDTLQNSELEFKDNPALKHVISLLESDSPFSTVYSDWKSSYKNIPNLLDSAISYVQLGLQYGIKEAASGIATQKHDPYVVGSGEEADVSVQNFQTAIDSLESLKNALHGNIKFDIDEKHSVVVNLGNFFNITDGFQDYLPYHKMVDPEDWLKPSSDDKWIEEFSFSAYAAFQIEKEFKRQLPTNLNKENLDVYFTDYFYNDDGYVDGYFIEFSYYGDAGYKNQTYGIETNGCSVKFKLVDVYSYTYGGSWVYDDELDDYVYADEESKQDTIQITGKEFSIDSDLCRVQDGKTVFATAKCSPIANIFNLTDKSGKVTVSYRDLATGHVYEDDDYHYHESYTTKELRDLIVFPDITFGGVFPEMTSEKFWDLVDVFSNHEYKEW